jgi:hypothetical protein
MGELSRLALVRSYVLNSLENGPARVADLVQRGGAEFGFSHHEVEAAAKHLPSSRRSGRVRYIGRDPPICLPFGGAKSRRGRVASLELFLCAVRLEAGGESALLRQHGAAASNKGAPIFLIGAPLCETPAADILPSTLS